MWCALRGPPLLGAIWDEEFLDSNTTSGSTSSMSSDGYWANLLRHTSFSVGGSPQRTNKYASGCRLLRAWQFDPRAQPEVRAELNWLATWPSTERWGRLTGHELS